MGMRARNTGSLSKRGSNSWRLRYWAPKGPGGRKIQVSETVNGTKKEAERVLRLRLTSIDNGINVAREKATISEYMRSWLNDVVRMRNTQRTHQDYSTILRCHIGPRIGQQQISKLTASDVERLQAELLASGLSANTVRHVHVVLSKALKDAMKKGMVHTNVCQLVEPPKVPRYEVDPPSIQTIQKILRGASESSYSPVYHLLAYTGMRRGEVLALKWANVDLGNRLISIVATAQRVPGKGILFFPPKSAAGRRGISIDKGTASILFKHRSEQAEQRLKLGDLYNNNDLVFSSPIGNPLDGSSLTRDFYKILDANRLPKIRLHDLRHAHASDLIRANIHPRIVQDRLGHASAAFTMQVYGHVSAELQKQAAEAYAKAIESS